MRMIGPYSERAAASGVCGEVFVMRVMSRLAGTHPRLSDPPSRSSWSYCSVICSWRPLLRRRASTGRVWGGLVQKTGLSVAAPVSAVASAACNRRGGSLRRARCGSGRRG